MKEKFRTISIFDTKAKGKVTWFVVRRGKMVKISPKSVMRFLNKGFVIARTIEEGNKTTIETSSPRTREEALKEHRKRYGSIPF